ncbi:MAG: hypothetical protein PHQ43_00185 [Dehalococcoidales bacterium]|nr:hypothetical protein [Dehalococcoidales bacterium]
MPIIPFEVDRIEPEPGEWVDIKRRMTYADHVALQESMFKVVVNKDNTDGQIAVDDIEVHTGKLTMLKRNIVAWSYKDAKGNPAPVTPQNIESLDVVTANNILTEIARRNPQKKAGALTNNSLPSSTGEGEASQPDTKNI